jgi:hypothetical protein
MHSFCWYRLADRYDNLMPESSTSIFPSQGLYRFRQQQLCEIKIDKGYHCMERKCEIQIQSWNFKIIYGARNRVGNELSYRSSSLCTVAYMAGGIWDNPIPTRFLSPIDCSKVPAQVVKKASFNKFCTCSYLFLVSDITLLAKIVLQKHHFCVCVCVRGGGELRVSLNISFLHTCIFIVVSSSE